MNKTLVKLVWSLAMIVLIVGAVRFAIFFSDRHSADQKILIEKSK